MDAVHGACGDAARVVAARLGDDICHCGFLTPVRTTNSFVLHVVTVI
nr:hypothetical protein JVH1_2510 [Rhodococcus sp. JVH1]